MGKLAAIVIGALGGFVAGILLAPKSGKETRQDIVNSMKDAKGKAADGFEVVKEGSSHVKDEIVEGAKSAKTIAQDAASQLKDEATKRAASIRNETSKTVKDVRAKTS